MSEIEIVAPSVLLAQKTKKLCHWEVLIVKYASGNYCTAASLNAAQAEYEFHSEQRKILVQNSAVDKLI